MWNLGLLVIVALAAIIYLVLGPIVDRSPMLCPNCNALVTDREHETCHNCGWCLYSDSMPPSLRPPVTDDADIPNVEIKLYRVITLGAFDARKEAMTLGIEPALIAAREMSDAATVAIWEAQADGTLPIAIAFAGVLYLSETFKPATLNVQLPLGARL